MIKNQTKKQFKQSNPQNKQIIQADQIRQSQWPYNEADVDVQIQNNKTEPLKMSGTKNNFNKIYDRVEINKVELKPSGIMMPKVKGQNQDSQEQSEQLQILEENKRGNIQNLKIRKPEPDHLRPFNSKDYTIQDVSKYGQTSYNQLLKKDLDERAAKQNELQNMQKRQRNQRLQQEKQNQRMNQQLYQLQNKKINSQITSGNLTIIWVFILKNLEQKYVQKLKQIHSGFQQKDYVIPYFDNIIGAKQILNKSGCGFKILIDLDNAQILVQMKEYHPRIISIYLYNNDRVRGVLRSLELKKKTKKIRITYVDLNPLFAKAQRQIQDSSKFLRDDDGGLQQVKFKSKLPAFLKLSGEDKTEATSYRTNLYGALKLQQQKQRRQKLRRFVQLIQRKYFTDNHQLQNLEEYQKINHINPKITQQKSFKILQFYVKQSFYYKVLNSSLRISKTIEDFKPITIPFNQTYHAIKYFHQLSLSKNGNFTDQLTLYRGAPLNKSDFNNLKTGNFVQLLGFISTSQNYERAKSFLDRKNSYMFVFAIKKMQIKQKLKIFDHGYVDINRYNIAEKHYKQEEEFVLNALNVYKIAKIESEQQNIDGISTIYLQYGAIFQLYEKDDEELTESQRAVLTNYRYCAKISNQIQDHGDVLLKAHQFDKCKDFYKEKIKSGEQNAVNYNKLANAHQECGQLDEAYQNALKSLEKYQKMTQQTDHQQCMKIVQVHKKNAVILSQHQDYNNAIKGLSHNIQLLADQDWLVKAKILREIGFLRYKEGNIKESQKYLQQSEQIILGMAVVFQKKRNQILWRYRFKYILGCCCFSNSVLLEAQKEDQLDKITKNQKQMKKMNQQIKEVLIEIRNNMRQVAQYIGDQKKIQQCIQKAQQYSLQLTSANSDDPFKKAKINVIQAKVQNSLQTIPNILQSYKLMQEAIQIIQAIEPMHQKVGQYSKILGNMKQKQFLKKNLVPSKKRLEQILNRHSNQNKGQNEMKIYPLQSLEINNIQQQQKVLQKFDFVQYDQNYRDCRANYQKAIMVISNNKGEQIPEVFQIRNHLGLLEFDYSHFNESSIEVSLVLNTPKGNMHTEGAKAALILVKISMSKGQLKAAFKQIQKASTILKRALIKKQNDKKYLKTFKISPVNIQIELWRCKIYNRQMKHDLALSGIKQLKKIANKKLSDADGVGFLANIYEEQAESLIAVGDNIGFQKYFLKAIKLRSNQMGEFNIPNAISICNMFKYMLLMDDLQSAKSYLNQAAKIFSHFSVDHPTSWIILLSTALLMDHQHKQDQSYNLMRESVKIIQKKYSQSHITLLKVKFKYAQFLNKCSKYDEAIDIYQFLQKKVAEDLRISQTKEAIQSQIDDQKFMLRKTLAQSIRQTANNKKKSTANLTSFKILSNQELINSTKQIPVKSIFPNKNGNKGRFEQTQTDFRQLIEQHRKQANTDVNVNSYNNSPNKEQQKPIKKIQQIREDSQQVISTF